jgi:hypothetical protein
MIRKTIQSTAHWFARHPLAFFLAWSLWLSVEYWALGDLSYLHIHDNADQIIPVSSWLTESPERLFEAGILPEMSGVDRFATTAWINLHRLFCLVMPVWLAHGLFIFIQRFVAGYFACLFLKRCLKVPPAIAIVAGMAYSLIGLEYGEMRLMHNLSEPGFPLMLYALCAIPLRASMIPVMFGVGVIFSLGMDPMGSMPFFIPTSILIALILRKDIWQGKGFLGYVGLVFVFGVGCLSLRIPGIWATLYNAPLSHRSDWQAGLLVEWTFKRLLMLKPVALLPWWGCLALATLWIFDWRKRDRGDVAILVFVFIGVLGGPLIEAGIKSFGDALGPFKGFNFTRFDRTMPLALICAAALGVRSLNKPQREGFLQMSLIVSLVLGGLCIGRSLTEKQTHWVGMSQAGKNWRTLYGNPEIKAFAESLDDTPVRCASAGTYHEYHPLYALPHNLELADGYVVMYPNWYQAYWNEVVRPIVDAEPEYLKGHFRNWGSRVYLFHSSRPENANIPIIPFASWYNLDLLSLGNVKYILSQKPIEDERLKLRPPVVTDADRDAWWALPIKEKIRGYIDGKNPGAPMYVYENPEAVDRFFLAHDIRTFGEDEAELFQALGETPLSTLTNEVFVFQSDVSDWMMAQTNIAAEAFELLEYEPERAVLHVLNESAKVLVFSNLFYPWWTCTLNSEPVPVVRAYGTYMAVRIPPGDHKVRFEYSPPYKIF